MNLSIHTCTLQMTSQKNVNFATSKVKNKINVKAIDRLSLGIYAPGPQVLTYRPQMYDSWRIYGSPHNYTEIAANSNRLLIEAGYIST